MEPGSNINGNNFPAINKNVLRETNMYINNHNAFNFYEFSAVFSRITLFRVGPSCQLMVGKKKRKTTSEFTTHLVSRGHIFQKISLRVV